MSATSSDLLQLLERALDARLSQTQWRAVYAIWAIYGIDLLLLILTIAVRLANQIKNRARFWLSKAVHRPTGTLYFVNHVAIYLLLMPCVAVLKFIYSYKRAMSIEHPEAHPFGSGIIIIAIASALIYFTLWTWLAGICSQSGEALKAFVALSASPSPKSSFSVPYWLQNLWLISVPVLLVVPMIILGAIAMGLQQRANSRFTEALALLRRIGQGLEPDDNGQAASVLLRESIGLFTKISSYGAAITGLELAWGFLNLLSYGVCCLFLIYQLYRTQKRKMNKLTKPSFGDKSHPNIQAIVESTPSSQAREAVYLRARLELLSALIFIIVFIAFLCGCAIPYLSLSQRELLIDTNVVARYDLLGDGFGYSLIILTITSLLLYSSVKEGLVIWKPKAVNLEPNDDHPLQLTFPTGATDKEIDGKIWGVSDYDSRQAQRCQRTKSHVSMPEQPTV